MDHSQHAVALAHLVVEPVAVEPQISRDRFEKLAPHRVERMPELERGALEACIALDPDIVGHRRAVAMAGRQLAPDLPELLEVVVLRSLGRLDAERGVTARTADAWHVVAALCRLILC